jgi:hypothetical protein
MGFYGCGSLSFTLHYEELRNVSSYVLTFDINCEASGTLFLTSSYLTFNCDTYGKFLLLFDIDCDTCFFCLDIDFDI